VSSLAYSTDSVADVQLDMAPPKTQGASRGTIHSSLLSGLVTFTLRAIPLPPRLIEFLQSHTSSISNMLYQRNDNEGEAEREQEEMESAGDGTLEQGKILGSEEFWVELEKVCAGLGGEWAGVAERVWGFGPKRLGANLLLDPIGKKSLRWVVVYSFGVTLS
jgi:ribosome assembly protein 1